MNIEKTLMKGEEDLVGGQCLRQRRTPRECLGLVSLVMASRREEKEQATKLKQDSYTVSTVINIPTHKLICQHLSMHLTFLTLHFAL